MNSDIYPLLAFILQVPAVITATTLHEFIRALMSTLLGDVKPKNDGRLSLNPIKHFEPIGFLLAWLTGFGWGKPVETSTMYYKNRKQGVLLTAVMPSLANIVFAIIIAILLAIFGDKSSVLTILFYNIVRFNISLAVYNIVPVTPMDGLKVLSVVLPANKYFSYIQREKLIQIIFMFILFMGYTDIIFAPIINTIVNILI